MTDLHRLVLKDIDYVFGPGADRPITTVIVHPHRGAICTWCLHLEGAFDRRMTDELPRGATCTCCGKDNGDPA